MKRAPSEDPTVATEPPTLAFRDDLPVIGERYRVLGMLGGGGMGNVYLAHDLELDENVAVKLLKPSLSKRREQIEMLRREVKFARRVTHPNVLRTYDIGDHEDGKFITMELVEGRTLADLLPQKMPLAEVARIARAVCAGLGAAHDAGVLHRDLKPSNVLLADDGRILLSDFGIARLADDPDVGSFAGTPGYMAPELLANEPVDARADIWSLGVLLFELIAGERPFRASREDMLRPLLDPTPDPRERRPEIPLALARVVTRCLARRPEARFAHPREVVAAIDAALPTPGRSDAATFSTAQRRARVLAVLPFANLGPPEDAHLSEGLTTLLVGGLDSARLRVPSRGAVEAAGGAGRDPLAVGRDLGAEAVVVGSTKRTTEGVDVEVRVVGTGDGLVLFTERMAVPVAGIVGAAERASRSIAHALLVERKQASGGVHDESAVDLYLKGIQEYRGRWEPARAIDYLARAAERAPDDPTILAAYAAALARRLSFGGRASDLEEARAVVARALALAPDRPEPHVASASVLLHLADNVGAARAVLDALQVAPHHADAHQYLGLLAFEVIGAAEGLAHLYTATTLDPSLMHARWWIARGHALLGEWARSDTIFDARPPEADATNDYWVNRARALSYRRTPERVAKFLSELASAPDFPTKAALQAAFARMSGASPPADALRVLEHSRDQVSMRRAAYLACVKAEIAAVAGDVDAVLGAIEEADRAAFVDVVWLDGCPTLEEARRHPRFAEIRARVAARAARVREVIRTAGAAA